MKLFATLTITAGLAISTVSAQDPVVATDPVGVVNMVIPSGNSLVSPVFVENPSFSGMSTSLVEGVDSTTITFEATLTPSAFAPGAFPTYYAEVSSGSAEGFSFDVLSNTATTVVVDGLLITDFGLSQNETFIVRKHVTLDSFFAGSALARRDSVTFFNSDGTSETIQFDGSEWDNGEGLRPIYPGTGFLTALRSDVEVTTDGMVKTTDTIIPIYNTGGVINLVTTASAVEVTLESLGLEGQLQRRDSIEFFEPGSLALIARLEVQSDGSLLPVEGSIDDISAGEPFLVNSRAETNLSVPGYDNN
ncbi:MAG: hypothetical protein AAFX93_09210 [Verrucomicrobiota bacterium]